MLPFPRTAVVPPHGTDTGISGSSSSSSWSSAWAMLLLGFVILVGLLLAACLFSSAARRLFSLLLGASPDLPPPASAAAARRCRPSATDQAAAELVGSLPVRAHGGAAAADAGDDGDVCAVCLGELRADERVKAIPACGHVFHPPCIDRWLLLAAAAGHASCPLCRCHLGLKPPPPPAAAPADAANSQRQQQREDEAPAHASAA